MDGLEKLVLIKSAKFDFAEVDLNGNSLFIGANGAGKTTLLRAILYFYTADARTLGISSSKKISFSDYYFDYEHSYIVYMYKKDGKYVLVTLYKDSSVKFRFCLLNEIPNIKDIYIENSKPIEPSKLWLKLKNIGLLSNVLNSSEYKKVLYSKNTKLKHFSLFEAKEYDGFIKTLSNIFINSKVDSEAIKKVIVSSLDVSKKIDIEQIKRHLEGFNTTYEDILNYEKNKPKIAKLLTELDRYQQIKNDMQDNFSTINNSKNITKNEIVQLKDEKSNLIQKQEKLTEKEKYENSLYAKRESKITEILGALKDKIKTAKNKESFYIKEKITDKIKEYKSVFGLKEKLNMLKEQVSFLTKDHQEIENNHNNQIQSIQNSFDLQQNTLDGLRLTLKSQEQAKLSTLQSEQNEKIQEIKDDFSSKVAMLKDVLHANEITIKDTNYAIENLKKEQFVFKYEEQLKQSMKQEDRLNLNISDFKKEIVFQDEQLSTHKKLLDKDMENIVEKEEFELKQIKDKVFSVQNLIEPNKDSLTHKLYKNNLDIDKYLFFIKDDVLNSDIDVDMLSSSNQIFELNFMDFKAPKNSLVQTLEKLKKQEKEITKEFLSKKDAIINNFRNFENNIYRKKRGLNDKIKSLEIELSTMKTKISSLKNQQIIMNKEFDEKNTNDIKILENKLTLYKEKKQSIEEELKNIQDSELNKIKTKKAHFTKLFNSLDKDFSKEFAELKRKSEALENDKKLSIEEQINSYKALLKTKNIDTEKLGQLKDEQKTLELKINHIKEYVKIITEYEKDKKEHMDLKKTNELKLKEENTKLENLSKLHTELTNDLNEQLKLLSDSIANLTKQLTQKEEALKRVDSFEMSATMREYLEFGIKYEPNSSYLDVDVSLENIYNLASKYRETEKSINHLIGKLNTVFDNSLSIKRELNYIVSAHNIRRFEMDGKINYYKDLQASNLNQIVKSSVEQYDNLILHSGKIESLVNKITKLFKEIKIGVIDSLSLRYSRSNNKVIEHLSTIKSLNNETPNGYGISLFNDDNNADKIIKLLKKLRDTIEFEVVNSIDLEDSFVLEFRVVENGNDSKYQISLDMIGSNGTDVLVKSMIYIAMLHIFKTKITKKELLVNVILDEIGILSQKYLKELIMFANKYGIYFINGAPDEKLVETYKRVSLVRNINNRSIVQELIAK